MKKTIRKGVFETNSSSTHSITICTSEEYKKFLNGELYVDYNGHLYTLEQIEAKYEKDNREWKEKYGQNYANNIEHYMELAGFYDYQKWEDYDYLEEYKESYTTPNGEEIVAFGKYGYDG